MSVQAIGSINHDRLDGDLSDDSPDYADDNTTLLTGTSTGMITTHT